MRYDVAALYVDRLGPYPKLVEHWWDEARDARTYDGPWPVVAHPPCGPWGRLRHLSKKDDPALALRAVEQVRANGGVLEHPQHSLLFRRCGLPRPGEPADEFGGFTLLVSQCDWGHPARKWSWIYMVGTGHLPVPAFPPPRQPTHWISGGRGGVGKKSKTTPVPLGIKVCSAQQRRRTPVAFAEWLLELAATARVSQDVPERPTCVVPQTDSRSVGRSGSK